VNANRQHIDSFLDNSWLESGLSQNTLSAYRSDLQIFAKWCTTIDKELHRVEQGDIQGYLSHRLVIGSSPRSTARLNTTLRRFYQYLLFTNVVDVDPMLDLASPKIGRSLPKIVSEEQVDRLLNAPDPNTALGQRDIAMLETLYATGLRVTELVTLQVGQLDRITGLVRVMGKGGRERLVPFGAECLEAMDQYIRDGRAELLGQRQSDFVFVTKRGSGMSRQAFWQLIKRYALIAGMDSTLSPHTLRHAFATHLINHGADLRSVQMLLGHSDLSTTQIYTHVATARLQNLHREHHPRG
jgi:integrase/recombinase XerD